MKLKTKLMCSTAAFATMLAYQAPVMAADDDKNVEEIVITAGKVNRKLEDLSNSIAVVTSEDMENQMVSDLNQMFKNEPGVSITGDAGGAQNVVIRGMSGDRVLMIKDGMRMNEGYGADGANDIVGRGNVDIDTIKQVEVSKGPASAQYGADAMGGVVVFTTKDARDYLDDGDEMYIGAKAGYAGINSQKYFSGTGAVVTGPVESVLSVTKRDGGETQNFYDENSNGMEVESLSVLAKMRFNINDTDYLSVSHDYWDQDAYTPDAGKGDYGYWQIPGYKIAYIDSFDDARTEATKFAYHYEGDAIESFDMSIYRNKTRQNDGSTQKLEISRPDFTPDTGRNYINSGVYDQKTEGFNSNLVSSFDIGGMLNHYAIGLDLDKTTSGRVSTEYRNATGPGYTDEETKNEIVDKFPRNSVKRLGVYIADYIDLIDDTLTLNFGTRYDKFTMTPENTADAAVTYSEISKNRFSSNVGLNMKASDTLSFVGSFSQGYKVPPYDLAYIFHDNTFVAFPYYGYVVHPSEELEPETSESFEVGVRYNDDKVNFSAYMFENRFKNFIEIQTLYWEFPYAAFGYPGFGVEHTQYVNIAAVKIKGMEASFSYKFNDNVNFYTNMSKQTGKDQSSGDYIRTISPFNGVIGVNYYAADYGVDLSMRWAKKMKKVNDGSYINPGYKVVDVTSYYNVTENATVRFGLKNLFDERYTEFNSVSAVAAGANTDNYTKSGRTVSVNVAVSF